MMEKAALCWKSCLTCGEHYWKARHCHHFSVVYKTGYIVLSCICVCVCVCVCACVCVCVCVCEREIYATPWAACCRGCFNTAPGGRRPVKLIEDQIYNPIRLPAH